MKKVLILSFLSLLLSSCSNYVTEKQLETKLTEIRECESSRKGYEEISYACRVGLNSVWVETMRADLGRMPTNKEVKQRRTELCFISCTFEASCELPNRRICDLMGLEPYRKDGKILFPNLSTKDEDIRRGIKQ